MNDFKRGNEQKMKNEEEKGRLLYYSYCLCVIQSFMCTNKLINVLTFFK